MAEFLLSAFADEADALLEEQITALKKSDIQYIELRSVDGISLTDCPYIRIREIKNALENSNIQLSAVASPIGKSGILEPFTPCLDKFKRTLEIADILRAPNIRLFSFFIPKQEEPSLYRDEVMERMAAFLDEANGSGVACCHENEKDIYGDIPSRVLDLHQTLPALKCIFDPANYIQCKVSNLPEAFVQLIPYIEYMHIKDACFTDGFVVPAGCGDGELGKLLELFAQIPGKRFLTVEPHLSVFKGFNQLKDERSMGDTSFRYKDAKEAFSAAINALKGLLINASFIQNKEEGGQYIWKR